MNKDSRKKRNLKQKQKNIKLENKTYKTKKIIAIKNQKNTSKYKKVETTTFDKQRSKEHRILNKNIQRNLLIKLESKIY